jgi:hypothetical protein
VINAWRSGGRGLDGRERRCRRRGGPVSGGLFHCGSGGSFLGGSEDGSLGFGVLEIILIPCGICIVYIFDVIVI